MRSFACMLAIIGIAACQGAEDAGVQPSGTTQLQAGPGSPALHPIGRTVLEESDSLYVARPAGVAIGEDGTLFVSDGFWGRVLRFRPDGALAGVYGRRGEGPGELKDPGTVSVWGDEVWVADVGMSRLSRFSVGSGAALGEVRHRGILTSIAPGEGGRWLGVQNLADTTALGWIAEGAPTPEYRGRLPGEFLASPPLAGIFNGIQVVAWGDTVVAGFMGLNRVHVMRRDGTFLREIRVPTRTRRGELPDVVQALRKMEYPEMFASSSALFRMHRLPSGTLALVYYDQTIDGDFINAVPTLTLLSRDLSRACVDGAIPLESDAQPYTAFVDDQLWVLQQRVRGESATTFVDRYRIDERACFGG